MRVIDAGLEAAHDHKTAMNQAGLQSVVSAFEYLTKDDKFLDALCHNYNTNGNEAFHSLLWQLTTKNRMTSFGSMQFAADLATCYYNDGREFTLARFYERMGLQLPLKAKKYCEFADSERVNQKEQRKEVEQQRASARCLLEMESRMNLLPAMAVSSEAIEEQILSQVTNTPVKKRKYDKQASAEKATATTRKKTRRTGPDEDYMGGSGLL